MYVLSGSHYETWQHVYTAVTRGKKHVIIIGTYAELEQAVKYAAYRYLNIYFACAIAFLSYVSLGLQ